MTLGGEGVKGHDVINYNLWAGKNLHDSHGNATETISNVLQRAEAIFKEPQNNYKRFVELWYQHARREGGMTKQGIAQVRYALKLIKLYHVSQ